MVRLTAHESGLAGDIEFLRVESDLNGESGQLARISPLARAPVLQVTAQDAFFDSRTICECLNELGSGLLVPPDGPPRWMTMRRQAIAIYLMDQISNYREFSHAASAASMPDELASMIRVLSYLEDNPGNGEFLIGDIAVLSALEFIDQFPPLSAWRIGRPRLAEWHQQFFERSSVVITRDRFGNVMRLDPYSATNRNRVPTSGRTT